MSDQGEPYKIEHAAEVPKQIQAIRRIAEQTGKLSQFVDIMEEALRRLSTDPKAGAIRSIDRSTSTQSLVVHSSVRLCPVCGL